MSTLKFKGNVATLDLPTLDRTVKYEMAKGGLPRNRPIEHFKLIRDIQSNIKGNTKLDSTIDTIYTSERQAMRVMYEGNEFKAAVGISYTDRGIQLAFGTHVNVCSNMMIWGQNFMSTYGANKVGFNVMMDAFDDWMKRFDEKRKQDMEIINALKKRKVKENELFEVLGRLIHGAERGNNSNSDGSSLNVSQTLRLIDNKEKTSLQPGILLIGVLII